jgi:hypothetical protein
MRCFAATFACSEKSQNLASFSQSNLAVKLSWLLLEHRGAWKTNQRITAKKYADKRATNIPAADIESATYRNRLFLESAISRIGFLSVSLSVGI